MHSSCAQASGIVLERPAAHDVVASPDELAVVGIERDPFRYRSCVQVEAVAGVDVADRLEVVCQCRHRRIRSHTWPGGSRLLRSALLGCEQHSLNDALVAGAAADVARKDVSDLRLGRAGVLLEQSDCRHDEARCAEPALEGVALPEGLLHGVQLLTVGEPLDSDHLVVLCLYGEHQARAHRRAVEQDGAGAAHPVLASEVGAGETELASQEIGQRDAHVGLGRSTFAVDHQLDVRAHALPPALVAAASSARRIVTRARWRRNSELPWTSDAGSRSLTASSAAAAKASAPDSRACQ